MTRDSTLETMRRRDRTLLVLALFSIVALASAYTIFLSLGMVGADRETGSAFGRAMSMPMTAAWTALDYALMLVMWAVMMSAMMLPSAMPMILVFAAVARRRRHNRQPYTSTGVFVSGYIVSWGAFAVLAVSTQWALQSLSLLSPMLTVTSGLLGGGLLLATGLFQFTKLKYVCLTHCQTPIGFITSQWRDGPRGALIMGVRHGTYCLGCCWMLMSLLFVLGVMNLVWIAALAAFVLAEKLSPWGRQLSRVSGVALSVWGVSVLYLAVT